MTSYVLAGNAIGTKSAVDVFVANRIRSGRPMYVGPDEPPFRPHSSAGINLPCKTLLMNCLLHEDIWPGDPTLMVYDMHVRGFAVPYDPSREPDRIDVTESVQSLGKGASRFRASEVGRHAEMVQHVCDRLGWDSRRLRGYRVRVQYPLLTAQYCITFDTPSVRK